MTKKPNLGSSGYSSIRGSTGVHKASAVGTLARTSPSPGPKHYVASMPNTGKGTLGSLGPSEGGHSKGSGRAI